MNCQDVPSPEQPTMTEEAQDWSMTARARLAGHESGCRGCGGCEHADPCDHCGACRKCGRPVTLEPANPLPAAPDPAEVPNQVYPEFRPLKIYTVPVLPHTNPSWVPTGFPPYTNPTIICGSTVASMDNSASWNHTR